ncbi:hypothetical protein Mapa_010542 [Marchantia paleacea]|nr:hypothetical protein Mapa_010542 [Marchantia paleacea]
MFSGPSQCLFWFGNAQTRAELKELSAEPNIIPAHFFNEVGTDVQLCTKMKLTFPSKFASPHTDLVSAVGWNLAGEVYSCSDDHTIWKWSRNGEALCQVCTVKETSFTDLQWYPSISQRHQTGSKSEMFVVGCTDGKCFLISSFITKRSISQRGCRQRENPRL